MSFDITDEPIATWLQPSKCVNRFAAIRSYLASHDTADKITSCAHLAHFEYTNLNIINTTGQLHITILPLLPRLLLFLLRLP